MTGAATETVGALAAEREIALHELHVCTTVLNDVSRELVEDDPHRNRYDLGEAHHR